MQRKRAIPHREEKIDLSVWVCLPNEMSFLFYFIGVANFLLVLIFSVRMGLCASVAKLTYIFCLCKSVWVCG